jgi:hypothetical protein
MSAPVDRRLRLLRSTIDILSPVFGATNPFKLIMDPRNSGIRVASLALCGVASLIFLPSSILLVEVASPHRSPMGAARSVEKGAEMCPLASDPVTSPER